MHGSWLLSFAKRQAFAGRAGLPGDVHDRGSTKAFFGMASGIGCRALALVTSRMAECEPPGLGVDAGSLARAHRNSRGWSAIEDCRGMQRANREGIAPALPMAGSDLVSRIPRSCITQIRRCNLGCALYRHEPAARGFGRERSGISVLGCGLAVRPADTVVGAALSTAKWLVTPSHKSRSAMTCAPCGRAFRPDICPVIAAETAGRS